VNESRTNESYLRMLYVCPILGIAMAQAKKLKGNNANQKGKGNNKSWKSKSKGETDDSKKDLAALVEKATQLNEQGKLNAVEPAKKRKVNWPSAEETEEAELCALYAELKDFNYEDISKESPTRKRRVEKWMPPCWMKFLTPNTTKQMLKRFVKSKLSLKLSWMNLSELN